MFATILMLLTGLALSGVAAWFSVAGLIAIFSAAPTSIMIMGGTLEVAKLVCASWVYNNWSAAPRALKAYMSVAVVVLMFITSMGIFGYLSKAHLEQRAATSDTSLQLERMEQDIAVKEKQLERLQGTEDRLNRAVDSLIEKDRVSQALAQRDRMKRELRSVANEKKGLQADIDKLYEAKIPLDISNRKVEAEIGPLKYIAELIYGEQAKSHFDQAVRAVIIILIVVFDPLAVIMLIAANFGMALHRKEQAAKTASSVVEPPAPVVAPAPEVKVEEISIPEVLEIDSTPDKFEIIQDVSESVPVSNVDTVDFEPYADFDQKLEIIESLDHPTVIDTVESPDIVWDADTKTWKPEVDETSTDNNLKYSISRRFVRLNPDYVSVDGKVHSVDTLEQEIISLEAVQLLMQKLTNNELIVDELTWAECEAILKYLDNDKPADAT